MEAVQEMVEREGGQLVEVPAAFIRPLHERPHLSSSTTQADGQQQQLPVIDVAGLLCPLTRPRLLCDIAHACADWGFFQAINHGVRDEVVEVMREGCSRFFNQPAHERNKLRCQNYENPVGYTSFTPAKVAARDWKDVLYVRDVFGVCNGFDVAPEICREAFKEYERGLDKLSNVLYEAIFESLGLSLAYVKEAVPALLGRQIIAANYYPPCPDPSLTYGTSGHSDIGTLTILLQDEVPGLQIKKGDEWLSVPPLPNAFVVNIADQIEILSNGKYKSIEHRALTNAQKTRMTIASFYAPGDHAIISPLPHFVSVSEPALYKEVRYVDYVKNIFSNS